MAKTHDEIVKGLKDWIEQDKEWLLDFAKRYSDELKKLLETDFEQLPLLMGDEDITEHEYLNLIYQARLQGKPIDPLDVCGLLANVEMDFMDYAVLHRNDGQLQGLAHALELLGEKELAADALRWTYSSD